MPPTPRMRIDPPLPPDENMRRDAELLDGEGPPRGRLYRWRPYGLSLGHFQKEAPADWLRTLAPDEVRVVRRVTGGGAILHAEEITYAVAGPDGAFPFDGPVHRSYEHVHTMLIELFRSWGVEAGLETCRPHALKRHEQPFLCFDRATSMDVMAGGKKLVGSAKRRRGGRALQHGSILLRAHPAQPHSVGLLDLAPRPLAEAEIMEALHNAFEGLLASS
ncbi:MAG TPA: lipoate--protein ligase family protein [Planctomycetes bacterium]|nr:lipoate--protein ligase family protein [Planctomycetota bacterium]